jgi:hypothetical protein
LDSRTTGMRSCTSAPKSFGSVMSIVQDFSTSPVAVVSQFDCGRR